jgi:hypothetical protein
VGYSRQQQSGGPHYASVAAVAHEAFCITTPPSKNACHSNTGDGHGPSARNATAAATPEPSYCHLLAAWDEDSAPVPQAVAPAQPPADDGDSWETAEAVAAAQRRSRKVAFAAAPAASSGGDGEEAPLQFGGGHVLELFDLTPAVRTQHLEAFLERLCSSHPVQPTIKCARCMPPPLPWLDRAWLPPAMLMPPACHHQRASVLVSGAACRSSWCFCRTLCFPAVRLLVASPCLSALAVRRWVDDCHAAVICSDPKAARQLLTAATAAGPGAEFRLRGYADAGSGTRKLPGSGAVAGVQPAALLFCFWLRC